MKMFNVDGSHEDFREKSWARRHWFVSLVLTLAFCAGCYAVISRFATLVGSDHTQVAVLKDEPAAAFAARMTPDAVSAQASEKFDQLGDELGQKVSKRLELMADEALALKRAQKELANKLNAQHRELTDALAAQRNAVDQANAALTKRLKALEDSVPLVIKRFEDGLQGLDKKLENLAKEPSVSVSQFNTYKQETESKLANLFSMAAKAQERSPAPVANAEPKKEPPPAAPVRTGLADPALGWEKLDGWKRYALVMKVCPDRNWRDVELTYVKETLDQYSHAEATRLLVECQVTLLVDKAADLQKQQEQKLAVAQKNEDSKADDGTDTAKTKVPLAPKGFKVISSNPEELRTPARKSLRQLVCYDKRPGEWACKTYPDGKVGCGPC